MNASPKPHVDVLLMRGDEELSMGLAQDPNDCYVLFSSRGLFLPEVIASDTYHPCGPTIWLFTTIANAKGLWESATLLRIIPSECKGFSIRDKGAEVFTGLQIKNRRIFLTVDGKVEEYSYRDFEMLAALRKVLTTLAEVPSPLVSFF